MSLASKPHDPKDYASVWPTERDDLIELRSACEKLTEALGAFALVAAKCQPHSNTASTFAEVEGIVKEYIEGQLECTKVELDHYHNIHHLSIEAREVYFNALDKYGGENEASIKRALYDAVKKESKTTGGPVPLAAKNTDGQGKADTTLH